MFEQIRWTMFLKVNSKKNAEVILRRFSKTIKSEIIIIECEQYWKDNTLFRAVVTSPLGVTEIPSAVFETLQICARVAHHWMIGGPHESERNHWKFSGLVDTKQCQLSL